MIGKVTALRNIAAEGYTFAGDAADEIERLAARLKATEEDRARFLVEMGRQCAQCDALRAKIESMERQEPAGIAGSMPGTSGFTMACFSADEVPMGTKLYTLKKKA